MKTISFIFFLSISIFSFAGNLKTIKKHGEINTEIFSIEKQSRLSEGLYINLVRKTKDTLSIGNYENGVKTGIWKYFAAKNQPHIEYDYSKKAIHFLSNEIHQTELFLVNPDTSFILTKVERPPLHLCDKDALIRGIFENNKIPIWIMERGLSLSCLVSFVIDSTGKITNIKMEKSFSQDFDKQLIASITNITGEWLPALLNGKAVDAKINILINISDQPKTKKFDYKPYFQVIDMIYFSKTNQQPRTIHLFR
jgi:hypothetical protein